MWAGNDTLKIINDLKNAQIIDLKKEFALIKDGPKPTKHFTRFDRENGMADQDMTGDTVDAIEVGAHDVDIFGQFDDLWIS